MHENTISLLPASQAITREHGPFRLRRIRPGLGLSTSGSDHGFGPLGLVDHAFLSPGLVVAMHEHRNDEIISYLRHGTMWHEDSTGQRLPLDSTHLAVMNSGYGLSHEESIPLTSEPVEMLQIFVRPDSDDLPPLFQHHPLATARSSRGWRWLVGPVDAGAPAHVRNQIWLYDTRLPAPGASILTPPSPGADAWLYIFSGAIAIGQGQTLTKGDSVRILGDARFELVAKVPSDLVLIFADRTAHAVRSGTLSG